MRSEDRNVLPFVHFHLMFFEKSKQKTQTPTTQKHHPKFLGQIIDICNQIQNIAVSPSSNERLLRKVKYSKPREGQYKTLHYNKGPSISQPRYAEVQLLYIRFCSQLKPTSY